MLLTIFSDGGSRGNPGHSGIGVVIKKEGENIAKISKYIGETTNNQAEYQAVLAGLKKAISLGGTEILCYLDSELIVKQMNGEYKVKNPGLIPLFLEINKLRSQFKQIKFTHIKRELNKEADKLANLAMDSKA